MNKKFKITLIGMPWAGKTTTCMALAERLGFKFIDLDHEVERVEGMSLIEVMNLKGADYFRNMGYETLTTLDSEAKIIISPAGSIIYHKPSMEWLENNSLIIFLDTPFEVIESRSKIQPKAVANLQERGLRSIYEERVPIYENYADIVISTKNKNLDQIVDDILMAI